VIVPQSSLFPRRSPASNVGRRWLFGFTVLLLILMAGVVLLAAVGSTVQSGVRAYVGGEGLWSKAQKDAVLHLDRYVETRSDADWAAYGAELEVIAGDSLARVELERPEADMTVVAKGFITGRNAPEDVAAMAMVFRTFRHISYIDRAITIWTAADDEVAALRQTGDRIRSAVLAGDGVAIASLTADLDTANLRLTGLERDFSQTLGEGARWLQAVLLGLTAAVVAMLVIITTALGRFTIRRVRANDLHAAEKLRASESRLRLLLDHLPGIVWTTDERLTITSLSGEGLTRLGIDEALMVGLPLDALLADDVETKAVTAAHRNALAGKGGGSYRATVGARTFQINVDPLTVDKRVIGVIGIGLDLTHRLELEARVERSTRLESIGRLAGGVAHDFNNLLTAITGYSDLLVSALPEGDERRDAEEIRRAAKRATDLTNQLLAFGRRSVLKPEFVSPNAVIDEMRNMVQRLMGDEVVLEFDLDPETPLVLADPGQLEQVILNLAVNARDAMPDGGRLLIATRAMRAERDRPGSAPSRVAISVTDTGVGMDEATRARIFEPFFTTKDHGKGTGLGLSTVYGIVGQSGGTIHVTSEIGVGATFTITLAAASATGEMPAERGSLPVTWGIPNGPVRAALKPRALALVNPARERDPGDTSYSPTILLAEDEPAVRSLVEHVLETAGFTVIAAIDGREALDMAENLGSIDLLLTDVMMPRINGPDLAAALREQRPDQRILFMSGFTDDVLGERGIIAPEVELLTKPFTPDELVARIQQVLAAPSVAAAAPSKGG
jgi:signal transduction histidine kinase/ActR/RegA family two-component response regulator